MSTLDATLLETLDADLEEFRRQLRVRLRRAVRNSLGRSVGSPAFRIIETLGSRGPLSPAELAAAMEVRTSTMAAHLDRLEELGWARRGPGRSTSRVLVRVTPAGRQACEQYRALRRAVLSTLLEPLAPGQMDAFASAVRLCARAENGDAGEASR